MLKQTKYIYFSVGAIIGVSALIFVVKKLFVKFKAVSIAKREWQGWGKQTINKQGNIVRIGGFEANKGFSERVQEYWNVGTGKNFDGKNRDVAWSSAFISFLFKKAGAGNKFVYSPLHSKYIIDSINNRKENKLKEPFVGYKISEVSPKVGDLVCYSRQSGVTYNTTGSYFSHCDIVVKKNSNNIEVIGGNVADSVTKRIIKTDKKGRINDKSKNWFTVLKTNI